MAGATVKAMRTDMGADELKPQIRKWINDGRKEHPALYKQYMNVSTTDEAYVEDYEIGGFGAIPKKDEGDYINFAVPPVGNKTRYQPDMYQLAFAITYQDRLQNRIGKVQKYSRSLERAGRATVEQIAAMPFNLGFSSLFHGSDNKPLFSATHVAVDGSTVDNTGTAADLTTATLETAIGTFLTMVGPDGFPIAIQPKYLIVHPSNQLAAERIVGSTNYWTGAATAPEGVPNVIRKYGLVVISNPYLTDQDAWFLLGDKDEHEVQVVWGEMPKDRTFVDEYTMDHVFSHWFQVVSGFSTYVGAYGNPGA